MKQSEYDKKMEKYRTRALIAFLLMMLFAAAFPVVVIIYGVAHTIVKIILYGLLAATFICCCVWLFYGCKITSLKFENPEPDEGYHVNMDITVTTVKTKDE